MTTAEALPAKAQPLWCDFRAGEVSTSTHPKRRRLPNFLRRRVIIDPWASIRHEVENPSGKAESARGRRKAMLQTHVHIVVFSFVSALFANIRGYSLLKLSDSMSKLAPDS